MVGMKTFICTVSSILLFLTACNSSVESYKLMYEGYVKELSDSSRYFGRTDYKGGNVIAADFITQEIRKLQKNSIFIRPIFRMRLKKYMENHCISM